MHVPAQYSLYHIVQYTYATHLGLLFKFSIDLQCAWMLDPIYLVPAERSTERDTRTNTHTDNFSSDD